MAGPRGQQGFPQLVSQFPALCLKGRICFLTYHRENGRKEGRGEGRMEKGGRKGGGGEEYCCHISVLYLNPIPPAATRLYQESFQFLESPSLPDGSRVVPETVVVFADRKQEASSSTLSAHRLDC